MAPTSPGYGGGKAPPAAPSGGRGASAWYKIGTEPAGGRGGGADGEPEIAAGAVLRGRIRAGSGVRIGHGCVIEGDVEIGRGTRIDHHAVLRGRVRLGAGNWIYPFCAIGTGPQHSRHLEDIGSDPAADAPRGEIRIGSGNIVREYTTVHMPAVDERTSIGSRCHILAYSHVAHDCRVGDGVTMANGTTLGGHCAVGDRANVGLNVSVHPFCRIGRYSMVGMMNPVVKDVLPFALVNRQRFARLNRVGMQRGGMSEDDILAVEAAYGEFERGAEGGHGAVPGGRTGGGWAREIAEFAAGSKMGFYPPEWPRRSPGEGGGRGQAPR